MPFIDLDQIERVNEFVRPEALNKTEVVTFSNLVLDKEKRKAIKRGGITTFNTNAAGGGIKGLYDAVDGSGNNYLLASATTKLIKSANGTGAWADVKTGLTNGLRARIVPYLDKFIVTNGTDTIFLTDLTTAWNLEVTKPDVSNVVSAEAEGGDLNISSLGLNPYFRYILVYVTDTGELSAPSQPFAHNFLYVGVTTYKTIRFDSLPVSADTRVVSRLLFRTQYITKNNTGIVYNLLATLDNSTTYFVDTFADISLDISQTISFVNVPATAKYPLIHKERLFLGYVSFTDKNFLAPEHTKVNGSLPSGYRAGGALTITQSTGGSLSTGTYGYRFALIDSAGRISDYESASVAVDASHNAAVITYNPAPPSANYTLKVYRTKAGGSTYYELPVSIPMFGWTFTDTTADASLTVTMPTNSTTTYKSGIAYSEVGQPASVLAYNILQVDPDDGDELTGYLDYGDRIIVSKKNSIYQILTLGHPLNWQIEQIYNKKGHDQTNIPLIKAGDKFYFISNNQVYRYPDYMEEPISQPKVNSFRNITSFTDMFYSNYYNWLFVIADAIMLIYDEKTTTWYKFQCDDQDWQVGLEKIQGSSRNTIIFGHVTSQIVSKYNTASLIDDDGSTQTEIVPEIIFKTFTMGDSEYRMRPRVILSNYKKRDDQGVSHQIYSPDEALQRYTTDSTNATNSTDYKSIKLITDAMTGTLIDTYKFYYRIQGAGLNEFASTRIFYNTRKRIRTV